METPEKSSKRKKSVIEEIEQLISDLKDEDSSVRWTATWILVKKGEIAIEALIEALTGEDWIIREEAAKTLAEMGQLRDTRRWYLPCSPKAGCVR